MKGIDLHIRSNHSTDGEYTPEELIRIAVKNSVGPMAVADHNTTSASHQMAGLAKKAGIDFIPAVELDCHHQGIPLHIIGYWVNPDDIGLLKIEATVMRQEKLSSVIRIERIENLGILVDHNKVRGLAINEIVVGEIVAEVALSDSRNAGNPILAPYRPGCERGENPTR